MENAVDALKIAFAVIVFTMALSVAMFMFTQARETSDVVLRTSDVTEYMEYIQGSGESRIVGLETIIPTLYNYYRENYTVIFLDRDGSFMPLYESKVDPNMWSPGYHNMYFSSGSERQVCSFDANEETRRREPWTTSGTGENNIHYYVTQHIAAFLAGTDFEAPSGNTELNYNYSTSGTYTSNISGSFIETFKDAQFDEYLGWYIYNDVSNAGAVGTGEYVTDIDATHSSNQQRKRVIVYKLR